jgi:hypothetical protein
VKKIVDGGVSVMGHIGLTPQTISVTGGFRAQGRFVLVVRDGRSGWCDDDDRPQGLV